MTSVYATPFAAPDIAVEHSSDGRVLLRSRAVLAEHPVSVIHAFRDHSDAHPDRDLLVERDGDDGWTRRTWGAIRRAVDRTAQGLLDRGLDDRPVMVLPGNGHDHLVVMLAAMTIGVPVAPVSTAYSLRSHDHGTLRTLAETVGAGAVLAGSATYAPAAGSLGAEHTLIGELDGGLAVQDLEVEPRSEVDRRCWELRPDTVAKILFTSGSTGAPKGVVNTHGMLATNQQQLRQVWPFLDDEPPILLDWLPWSHTFGGNHNLNMVLTRGGTLWVDDGRPAPDLVGRTARNLGDARPTIYATVPAGYTALLPLLERDPALARAALQHLRVGFFAAASLPQLTWDRVRALARRHGSGMTMTTSWGMTETGPAATSAHFALERSDRLGVPLPGVEVALVSCGAKQELRIRGPNVATHHWQRGALRPIPYDAHGFLPTGDAAALAEPGDPTAGLVFDGRLVEDFKLSTGTFVSASTVRRHLLAAAEGLVSDVVLCGENADYLSALVWLQPEHAHRLSAGAPDETLRVELRAALQRMALEDAGSSRRVERIVILTRPANLEAGEITDKGYVNQAVVRSRRAEDVALAEIGQLNDPRVVNRRPSGSHSQPS